MATAAEPEGPYKFVGMAQAPAASLPPKAGGQGDFALFVDTDGVGYMIMTHLIAGAGHRDMIVFRLTPDFLVQQRLDPVNILPPCTRSHPPLVHPCHTHAPDPKHNNVVATAPPSPSASPCTPVRSPRCCTVGVQCTSVDTPCSGGGDGVPPSMPVLGGVRT